MKLAGVEIDEKRSGKGLDQLPNPGKERSRERNREVESSRVCLCF